MRNRSVAFIAYAGAPSASFAYPCAFSLFAEYMLRPSSASPSPSPRFRLIGEAPSMRALREQILRIADSEAAVAIVGESGSGKELAARDLHAHSRRHSYPFIAVNCGAIPEALMESEFFGHRRGAFTGAHGTWRYAIS
jgi:DNA-binding NtrC family response regulator